MTNIDQRIAELTERLSYLQKKQYVFDNEIHALRNELDQLKNILLTRLPDTGNSIPESTETLPNEVAQPAYNLEKKKEPEYHSTPASPVRKSTKPLLSGNVEDFIGTNLASKVGILITIIGVFIGAKYAIDRDLVSPAMRIVLGYCAGAGLIITALKLKAKYENFSAVLMGGGLAILYFITYIGYGFYQLFPQALSFLLMLLVTVAVVMMALWYDKKIIAVLGQVGAYAVPFLLSDGSGNVLVLFTYISIINGGLLFLSFRKNWVILYRVAFYLTWIIYGSWLIFKDHSSLQAEQGLVFLTINFLTFYATFLAGKVVKKELYNLTGIALMLGNALLFFFLGISLVEEIFTNPHALTYFTISNAAVHFVIGYIIHRSKLVDGSVNQFITGLGVLFLTVAIPVELNGSWVTLLWAVEAAILTWIAYRNNRLSYLHLAIPIVLVAIGSLLQDWYLAYPYLNTGDNSSLPDVLLFRNINFLLSLFTIAIFGYIGYVSFKYKWIENKGAVKLFFKEGMPVVFVALLYFAFYNEIHFAWDRTIESGLLREEISVPFRALSLLIYTMFYLAAALVIVRVYVRNVPGIKLLLAAAIICTAVFLLQGLLQIGNLRDYYLANKIHSGHTSSWLLGIRYLCFFALAVLVISAKKAIGMFRDEFANQGFSLVFNIVLLSVICNEFIHWMDIGGYHNQYKLGLSVICAFYALILIITGIATKRKHLRMGAIVLFAVTLAKLFFYDLATLSTISRTIVLLVLGLILLVISFLYNKYKMVILGVEEDDPSKGSSTAA